MPLETFKKLALNLRDKIGFRNLIIKAAISMLIILAVQKLISNFLVPTPFFNQFLDIPAIFQLGKGIISLSIINSLIFGAVTFALLSYKKLVNIKDYKWTAAQLWFIISSIAFLCAQYYLKYLINANVAFFLDMPLLWGSLKLLLNILFGFTIMLTIFGWRFFKDFLKEFKREIMLVIIITISFFLLMLLMQNLWTLFSSIISKLLFLVFNLFFEDVTYKPFTVSLTMAEGGGPLLGINNFQAIVGKPCSGIDSFLLFTALYAVVIILDHRRLRKFSAGMYFVIGVIGMFFVNMLRILLLFIVGAYISPEFAVGMFHANVGWILFIVYFFIYWSIVSKYIYANKTNSGGRK